MQYPVIHMQAGEPLIGLFAHPVVQVHPFVRIEPFGDIAFKAFADCSFECRNLLLVLLQQTNFPPKKIIGRLAE